LLTKDIIIFSQTSVNSLIVQELSCIKIFLWRWLLLGLFAVFFKIHKKYHIYAQKQVL